MSPYIEITKINLARDIYNILQTLNFNKKNMTAILRDMVEFYSYQDKKFQNIFNDFLSFSDKFSEHFEWICEKQIDAVTLFDVYKCYSKISDAVSIKSFTIKTDRATSHNIIFSDVCKIANKLQQINKKYKDPFVQSWETQNPVSSEYILIHFIKNYDSLCTELLHYIDNPVSLSLFKTTSPLTCKQREYLVTRDIT